MKNENASRWLFLILLLVLTALPLDGCADSRPRPAARLVRAGDKVAVSYTCTLADGSLAVTNERRVANNSATTKSPLFRMPESFGPQLMTATVKPVIDPTGHTEMLGFTVKSFEEAVSEQLGGRLVGLPYDEERQVRLSADVPKGLNGGDRYLLRYRKTTHPKVLNVPLWSVSKRLGKDSVVAGASWQGRDGITFVVESFAGKIVKLRREIKSGTRVQTPFGPAVVLDKDKSYYTLNIDPKAGTLVRSGPLVGRIIKVTGKSFTLDYGNPFGFENLNCRVRVEVPAADAGDSPDSTLIKKRGIVK
ncbi:hypothetical protein ACOHYD_12245 [Desulfobacterota bacterium M19]